MLAKLAFQDDDISEEAASDLAWEWSKRNIGFFFSDLSSVVG